MPLDANASAVPAFSTDADVEETTKRAEELLNRQMPRVRVHTPAQPESSNRPAQRRPMFDELPADYRPFAKQWPSQSVHADRSGSLSISADSEQLVLSLSTNSDTVIQK